MRNIRLGDKLEANGTSRVGRREKDTFCREVEECLRGLLHRTESDVDRYSQMSS